MIAQLFHKNLLYMQPLAFTSLVLYSETQEKSMKIPDPNQALRSSIGISTALISNGLIIIGVGVTGPV